MKHYIILLVLTLSLTTYAQEVAKDGKVYEVKNEKIFLDGKEVTTTLDLVEKESILKEAAMISDKLKLKATALKEAEREAKRLETEKKNAEKAQKRAEKAQKKAEKAQKKAEKDLKKKQKLQRNFNKAQSNLDKSQSKYEDLKSKGRLSPVDEGKWLKKLKNLTDRLEKAKRKL